ncbi:MAG: alpha/beta fold hydrolase, partial [Alphaproteobacteria bacterium]|nr:alpha/beta fold hydrolase [Alphaproteobacteria bacterium]
MPTTRADGLEIAYRAEGPPPGPDAPPPVLLVHGFASNAGINWQSTGWIERLAAQGRRVLAPDLRGHGKSGAPRDPALYVPERMMADLFAVLDAEGVGRADVFGYSMGARLALAAALAAPGRVRRLVLGGVGETLLAPRDPEPVAQVLA